MKSSSSVVPARAGGADGVVFSRWALADLTVQVVEEALAPQPESAAERARAEAESRRREEQAAAEDRRRAAEAQEERVGEAFERGLEEGRLAGEIAERARLRTAVKAAAEALDEIRESEVRWTGAIEENICALAVAVARHVIGRELKEEAGPVLELVRAALVEFPIDQPIRIRLNPADLLAIRQLDDAGEPGDPLAQDRDARWIADSHVAPGGCVVEGRERIVDGRVDTALERIYRRLTYTHA